MNYRLEFKSRAVKDLKDFPKEDARKIIEKIEVLKNNLTGDVKRLTNFTPE